MTKTADVSRIGIRDLPTCESPKLFCNSVKIQNVHFVTSAALISKFVVLLTVLIVFDVPLSTSKNELALTIVFGVFVIWLISIVISFFGISNGNYLFLIPIIILELLIIGSIFTFAILFFYTTRSFVKPSDLVKIYLFVGVLLVLHIYYSFVTVCVAKFLKKKNENELFIQCQRIFDEVCDEMLLEEEIKHRERLNRTYEQKYYNQNSSFSFESRSSEKSDFYTHFTTNRNAYHPHYLSTTSSDEYSLC